MSAQKGKLNSRRKANILIAINTMFVIFGLASGFTGTMAWFNSQRSYSATAGSFSVSALPGTEFDLYYLDYFGTQADPSVKSKDGNYDSTIERFAGYEMPTGTAVFTKITFNTNGEVENNPNPTNITELWPAHRLTFALVITSGTLKNFTLTEWSETTDDDTLAFVEGDDPVNVCLSWAINIYGRAYPVSRTSNLLNDISSGFSSYLEDLEDAENPLQDQFDFDQDSPGTHSNIPIVTNPADGAWILYFSIEFSNEEDTFYSLNKNTGIYYRDEDGNSNCYEGLAINSLAFTLA